LCVRAASGARLAVSREPAGTSPLFRTILILPVGTRLPRCRRHGFTPSMRKRASKGCDV
jgi:hypothetical protein